MICLIIKTPLTDRQSRSTIFYLQSCLTRCEGICATEITTYCLHQEIHGANARLVHFQSRRLPLPHSHFSIPPSYPPSQETITAALNLQYTPQVLLITITVRHKYSLSQLCYKFDYNYNHASTYSTINQSALDINFCVDN